MRPHPRLCADLSLWSADLGRLREEVCAAAPHADFFHFDVADGHFVPSLLFFPEMVAQLRPATNVPFHVHLIVQHPDQLCDQFLDAGADLITVHVECGTASRRAAEKIAARGKQCGFAVKLETPLLDIMPWIPMADAFLLMGTLAGVKGRNLADHAISRMEQARRLAPDKLLFADGGIRQFTVPQLRAAGADVVVAGSLYFNAPDRAAAAEWWRGM